MAEDIYGKMYEDRYAEKPFDEVEKDINGIRDLNEQEELRKCFCNDLLYSMTIGYDKYNQDESFEQFDDIRMFLRNVEKLNENSYFFRGMYYFYKKEHKKCLECIDLMLKELIRDLDFDSYAFDEAFFIDYFIEPYKNAFDGFWEQIAKLLEKYSYKQDIIDFCKLINAFYTLESDEITDELIGFYQKYPEYSSAIELLGYIYYEKKMWRNAIGYFEKLTDDRRSLFNPVYICFMLAWSYSKCKEYAQEEIWLRKCAEIDRYGSFILNNLGFCLYRQNKLSEAKAVFEECLENNIDVKYAANNYVRVLIALGRNRDAKAFVKKGNYKIVKSLKEKVSKLEDTNARIKKQLVDNSEQDFSVETRIIDLGVKTQQFSSEKLLEDELTMRLEAGVPVFGLNLHVYNHKGDLYGRQYVFELGRLDLLCEDDNGNLYIIELKKDSGYDDAYVQTAKYLDWFEKAEISKGRNVYAIICLNSPAPELIEKVRKDKRVRLFEYQISYTEVN